MRISNEFCLPTIGVVRGTIGRGLCVFVSRPSWAMILANLRGVWPGYFCRRPSEQNHNVVVAWPETNQQCWSGSTKMKDDNCLPK